MKLQIASNLSLPLAAITEPLAIVAAQGRGKTFTGSVMAEEMLKAGQQIAAIDPMDVWFGLRSSADGKSEGFPVVIFGGDHADVALSPNMGRQLADFLVGEEISAVIVPDFETNQDVVEFMTAFLDRLLKQNRDPLHLFFDEAEAFAPERPAKYETRMLGAMGKLIKRGRVRGLGATLITQRTASINKNALSQAGGLFIMALSSPWDRAPVERWMSSNGSAQQMDELKDDLASLPIGEGYFWHPDWDIFKRVKIRERETFDSSATPEPGQKQKAPKKLSEIDREKVAKQFQQAVERAKADDPEELRRRIAELEKQLREVPTETKVETITEIVEVPAEIPKTYLETAHAIAADAFQVSDELKALVKALEKLPKNPKAGKQGVAINTRSGSLRESTDQRERLVLVPPTESRRERGASPAPASSDNGQLPKGEKKILIAVAQYPDGARRDQLTVLTGYKRSSRDAYIQRLKEKGLVQTAGAEIVPTEEGIAALGSDYEPLPEGEDLRAYWMQKLPEGERKILAELVAAYPDGVPRETLDEATGYKRSSRDAYIQRLRQRRLVTIEGGHPKASSDLF